MIWKLYNIMQQAEILFCPVRAQYWWLLLVMSMVHDRYNNTMQDNKG